MLVVMVVALIALITLLQDKAIVFKAAVASAQSFHLVIPFIVAIEDGLDEMRLAVGNVQEEPIVFQDSLNLGWSDLLSLGIA